MTIDLDIGGIRSFAVVCKDWKHNLVGVYIEVPIWHIKRSDIAAFWLEAALMKAIGRYWRGKFHSLHFNARMQRFGVTCFDHDLVTSPKGYTSFVFEAKVAPHKVGQFIGMTLAGLLAVPAMTDIRHSRLSTVKCDFDDLRSVALECAEAVVTKTTIAMIAARQSQIKAEGERGWGFKARDSFIKKLAGFEGDRAKKLWKEAILKAVKANYKARFGKDSFTPNNRFAECNHESVVTIKKSDAKPIDLWMISNFFDCPFGEDKSHYYFATEYGYQLRDGKQKYKLESSRKGALADMMTLSRAKNKKDQALIDMIKMDCIARHLPLSCALAITSTDYKLVEL